MSEPENAHTGSDAPSEPASNQPGEAPRNTPDKLFHDGYGKGIAKGKAQLLEDLGVENLDDIKSALEFAAAKREEEKSTADKLAEISSKYENLEAEVKTYREAASAEATTLFESLSDENKSAIEASGLPLEKMVPVMRQMQAAPSAPKKVGSSVNPPSESTEEKLDQFKTKAGLDPEYRKDPDAYFNKRLAAFNKRQAGEE